MDIKRGIRQSLRRFGLEIRRIGRFGLEIRRTETRRNPGLIDFLVARRVDVVLDVGANVGWFGQRLRERGYRGKIVSFEPIEEIFRELKALAERDGNWEAHRLALGAAAGHALINVSRQSDWSSILDQSLAAQHLDPGVDVVRQEEITVARLDDLFAPYRNRTVFLKIDTQGYERPVLDGAREALTQIIGVQLELPIVPLYKDTWSLADALLYMREVGFVLAQLDPFHWLSEDPVSAVEIDAVFRRRGRVDELGEV